MWRDCRALAGEISRALAETERSEQLIAVALRRCREALDAEAVVLLLLDPQSNELCIPAAVEGEPVLGTPLRPTRVSADRGVAGEVLRSRTTIRIDDVAADRRYAGELDPQTGKQPRALLCAALIAGERVIGVIQAVNVLGAAVFTADDVAFLEAVTPSLAAAIERVHLGTAAERELAGVEAQAAEGSVRLSTTAGSVESAAADVFRKEGDVWTIAFAGRVARLRDAKGLHYIACLLRHPGQEFHVTELTAAVGETPALGYADEPRAPRQLDAGEALRVSDLGNAGPLLDAKAKLEYKRRLDDLRAELEEAERFNDSGRAVRAREEIELLSEQLAAAVGLGGRDRVAAFPADRARQAVTKRIKAAMEKISKANPALGEHLAAAITTGYFCAYRPTASTSRVWSTQ